MRYVGFVVVAFKQSGKRKPANQLTTVTSTKSILLEFYNIDVTLDNDNHSKYVCRACLLKVRNTKDEIYATKYKYFKDMCQDKNRIFWVPHGENCSVIKDGELIDYTDLYTCKLCKHCFSTCCVMTPCCHYFCSSCLSNIFSSNESATIKCPICAKLCTFSDIRRAPDLFQEQILRLKIKCTNCAQL